VPPGSSLYRSRLASAHGIFESVADVMQSNGVIHVINHVLLPG